MYSHESEHGTIFNYNSDWSGMVRIKPKDGEAFEIPGPDILEAVAYGYMQGRLISKVEGAHWTKLLEGEA